MLPIAQIFIAILDFDMASAVGPGVFIWLWKNLNQGSPAMRPDYGPFSRNKDAAQSTGIVLELSKPTA